MSMYPKALESGGVSYPEAVDTLIQTAIARHSGKAREA
jgi:D-alanine-D-alanine ligase-like ATP-grasp enzyme